MKDDNYIHISCFMRRDLKLSGNELLCYAIIHGFSQDGESMFKGSLKYFEEWMGATKPTILKTLNNLVNKGLIKKKEKVVNNVRLCYYQVTDKRDLEGSKESKMGGKETIPGGGKEIKPGGKEIKPNNKDYNKENNKEKNNIIIEKETGQTSFLEPAENEKETLFMSWMKKEFPHIQSLQTPLTYPQFCKLRDKYGQEPLIETMENLDNNKKYIKTYFDAYRAINNWCKNNIKSY